MDRILYSILKLACIYAGLVLISGCQTTPQADALRTAALLDVAKQKIIEGVPFYPQQEFYCGPTTLSEVFNYHGKMTEANEIAPKLFIPGKEGSLQLEMISATRQYGFLPYSQRGTIEQIIRLVEEDIPVIVFQNLSIQLIPQWHYAVVIGYDLSQRQLTLHTGLTPNHTMSFELFEKTWARANYWLLAPLPESKTSDQLIPFTYISAAYNMLEVGDKSIALNNLVAATNQWPQQWLPYLLVANYYLEHDINSAIEWYAKGWHVGQYQKEYANNYAYALTELHCKAKALEVLDNALKRFPESPELLKTLETTNRLDNGVNCT